jgi:hypothetical protein
MNTDIEKVKTLFDKVLCDSTSFFNLFLNIFEIEKYSNDINLNIGRMRMYSNILCWVGDFDLEGLFRDSIRTVEYVNEVKRFNFTYLDKKSEIFRHSGYAGDPDIDIKDPIIVDDVPWEMFFQRIQNYIKIYNEFYEGREKFPKYDFKKFNYCSEDHWKRSFEYLRDIYCWFLNGIRIFFDNIGLKSFIDFVDRAGGLNNVEYDIVKKFPQVRSYSVDSGNDSWYCRGSENFKFMSLYDHLKKNGEDTDKRLQIK